MGEEDSSGKDRFVFKIAGRESSEYQTANSNAKV